MYNLKTYEDRLRAIADRHSLSINTEWNGTLLVALDNLVENIWAVSTLDLDCTLVKSPGVTRKVFDDACESLGLGGVHIDGLRCTLFGPSKPGSSDLTARLTLQRPGYTFAGLDLYRSSDHGGKPC